MKILTLLVLLMTMSGAACAQITQDPIPTKEELVAQIAPPLQNLKNATPWETLAGTTFERKKFHDEEYKMDYFVETPIFGDAVKALEGKEVTIQGYMLVYDTAPKHSEFLISGLPMSGEGHYDGPGALVVEIHPAEPVLGSLGIVRYKGKLELVPGELKARGIFYRLRDAVKAE